MELEHHQVWPDYDHAPCGLRAFLAWVMMWFGLRREGRVPQRYTPATPVSNRRERLMRTRQIEPFYHYSGFHFLKTPGQSRGQFLERVARHSPYGRTRVYQLHRIMQVLRSRAAPRRCESGLGTHQLGMQSHVSRGLWHVHVPP